MKEMSLQCVDTGRWKVYVNVMNGNSLWVDESVKAAILQKRHRDRRVMTD